VPAPPRPPADGHPRRLGNRKQILHESVEKAKERRAPRAGRSTEGSVLGVLGIIGAGAGIPPEMSNATSWSLAEGFVLLVGYVLAFVVAVWFVAWVDRKLSSRRLFREIYRELGIGRHPPR
jgi:nitrate/nitrite transporter NarK